MGGGRRRVVDEGSDQEGVSLWEGVQDGWEGKRAPWSAEADWNGVGWRMARRGAGS